MRIAAAHFDFAVKEKGISGYFDTTCELDIEALKNIEYAFFGLKNR